MNRKPRNDGQSFSAASTVSGVVVGVTEAVIICVIVMVDVGFMGIGLLVPFPIGHVVLHMVTVWLLFPASVSAASQIVLFCCSHVCCVKINRNSTVPKVSGTSFARKSGGGGGGGLLS